MEQQDIDLLHRANLQMLQDFSSFCDTHGIVYFLTAGTLLGAARHQGFIPWDDDADVMMDVRNYRKFLKLSHLLPPRYFVQNYRTDPKLGSKWTILRMNGTTVMPKDMTDYDIHFGVGMDIFPMYGLAATAPGRATQRAADSMMQALLYRDWAKAKGKPVSARMDLLYALLPGKLRIFALRFLERLLLRDPGHSDRAVSLYFDLNIRSIPIPADMLDPAARVRLPFEEYSFWAPGRYEELLEIYYGDWRTPLPPEERVSHADYIVDLEHSYKTYYTGP